MANDALLSCYRKDTLSGLAGTLHQLGWNLWASGGTAEAVASLGIPVVPTEKLTGISSILGGRVKTLHPSLHAGILAAGADRERMKAGGEVLFDLVAVDFYPFEDTPATTPGDPVPVDLIDVGGPAMARAAAKNWLHVIPATGRDCFGAVASALAAGGCGEDMRRALAARTFELTSSYDLMISLRLEEGLAPVLRYGENPHQKAFLHFREPRTGFAAAALLHGESLSYNNYLDADAAWDLVTDMPVPSVVIVKHGNPCGAATGPDAAGAFENAVRADRASPYGGILAVNTRFDCALLDRLKGLFLELVLAPSYDPDALDRLRARRKLRALEMPAGRETNLRSRSIWGGVLVQEADGPAAGDLSDAVCVTRRQPTSVESEAMLMAWRICRPVRSNAVVIADRTGALGVGAGQMSRIESFDLAVRRARAAGLETGGAALASDGLIPFRDLVDAAASAGITAIVQPGGSIRDEEVREAADSADIAMVLTSRRHFRH